MAKFTISVCAFLLISLLFIVPMNAVTSIKVNDSKKQNMFGPPYK